MGGVSQGTPQEKILLPDFQVHAMFYSIANVKVTVDLEI